MWLVDGQWARIVQGRHVNIGLQSFTKLTRKLYWKRFLGNLLRNVNLPVSSGNYECLSGDHLPFCQQELSYPCSTHARICAFLQCRCAVITIWIFTEFVKIIIVISLLKQLDFCISDNLLRKMLHCEVIYAEC
jgi:hypothetical protein